MVIRVLLDSNVYIGYRHPPDRHHEAARRAVDNLTEEFSLTRSAALEVAQISREKLEATVARILTEPSIRSDATPVDRKRLRLRTALDGLERDRPMGSFRTLVERFCEAEFSRGRDDLRNLPEWASDTVKRIVPDLKEFCGTDDLLNLPGVTTEADLDFIRDCEAIIGDRAISGSRDRQIFYDALVHAITRPGVRFATFDRTFAAEAREALRALIDAGVVPRGAISFHDLNVEDIPR